VNMTPIRPEPPEEPKPEEPKTPAPMTAASWAWLIGILVILGGPLAIWLYRLALGL